MITAAFDAYASYTVDSVYQWDINRSLEIIGVTLDSAPEIHFTNSMMDKSLVRSSEVSGSHYTVDIPNSLLQYPVDIQVYIGVYDDNSEFKVVETMRIPIIPRTRPTDYQIQDSDEEIYSFNELKKSLKDEMESQYYQPGETVSIMGMCPGFISNSGKRVVLSIPFKKSLEKVSLATVTAVEGAIYVPAGGTLDNHSSGAFGSDYSIATNQYSDNYYVLIDKSSAFTNAVNSSNVLFSGTMTVTFE